MANSTRRRRRLPVIGMPLNVQPTSSNGHTWPRTSRKATPSHFHRRLEAILVRGFIAYNWLPNSRSEWWAQQDLNLRPSDYELLCGVSREVVFICDLSCH